MIIEKYKCIYIHIPKCAGTTIEKFFMDTEVDSNDTHPFWIDRLPRKIQNKYFVGNVGNGPRQHFPLHKLPVHDLQKYFKFTFVRDPYSRAVSSYNYFCKLHRFGLQLKGTSSELRRSLHEQNFELFCMNIDGLWKEHRQSQTTYTKGCDYIGKVENINLDFQHVCDTCNIPYSLLEENNKTSNKCYTEYYNDKSYEIITTKYKADIDNFNYTFKNK